MLSSRYKYVIPRYRYVIPTYYINILKPIKRFDAIETSRIADNSLIHDLNNYTVFVSYVSKIYRQIKKIQDLTL